MLEEQRMPKDAQHGLYEEQKNDEIEVRSGERSAMDNVPEHCDNLQYAQDGPGDVEQPRRGAEFGVFAARSVPGLRFFGERVKIDVKNAQSERDHERSLIDAY